MAAPERTAGQAAGSCVASKPHQLQEQLPTQQQPEAAAPAPAVQPPAPTAQISVALAAAVAAPAAVPVASAASSRLPAGKGGKGKGRHKGQQRGHAAAPAAPDTSSRAPSRASGNVLAGAASPSPSSDTGNSKTAAAGTWQPRKPMAEDAGTAMACDATDATVPAASKEQPVGNRRSRSRQSQGEQDGGAQRQPIKASTPAGQQQDGPAPAGGLPSASECGKPASSKEPKAAADGRASGMPRSSTMTAEQPQQLAAAAPGPRSSTAPKAGGPLAANGGKLVAPASAGASAAPDSCRSVELAPQAAAAVSCKSSSGGPSKAPFAAEPVSSSMWVPLDVETTLSSAAAAGPAMDAAALQGAAADGDDCTAALSTPQRLSPGGGSPGSRPSSPGEDSLCSDGSILSSQDSWHCGVPENPSEYGLPYNFGGGQNLMLFHWQQDHAGQPLPLPHSATASPQRPLAERLPSRPGASGLALGPSRSLPPLPPSGGFYGAPLQPGGTSMAQPPAVGLAYHHHRNGSTSSSGSDGASFQPTPAQLHQQWQHSSLSGWAEPFIPGQLFTHSQLLVHPLPFVSHSQSAGRAQWGRQWQDADAYWQPQRCSGSWQDSVPVSPPLYSLPPQHSIAMTGYLPGGAVAGGGSLSAPASSVSSPVLHGRSGLLPNSMPPLPPLPVQVMGLQVPESADDSPDLERFLQAATPQVAPPSSGPQNLRLADLWRWYETPSTIGCEVTTVGGPRGPSIAYYLPYLSAVQLFVPASDGDVAAVVASASARAASAAGPCLQLLSYPNGLDSWPERMRPLVQWGEAANMRDRVPLHCRLLELCGAAGEDHSLLSTRIADMHPLSWFAVAWYPLYCVPEAPLTARFLTFHTLASLWESATEAAHKHQQQHEDLAITAATEVQRQQLQEVAQEVAQEAAAMQAAAQQPRAYALAVEAASPPTAPPRPRLPSRPSYKCMLDVPLPPAKQAQVAAAFADTATPTAVCSFPSSPTSSDAGTRTTLDSCPHSVDGASGCSGSLVRPSPASGMQYAYSSSGCGSSLACPSELTASSATASTSPSSTHGSPATSEAGDGCEALPVPVAGLLWYATGRDENWLETLVAAHLPPGVCPAPGTPLCDGGRVVGCWRDMAVLARRYPVAKGGPLGWEIQQEEMAQCAERLANGTGLLALRPRPGPAGSGGGTSWDRVARLPARELGICCPDYEFFCSRSARYG